MDENLINLLCLLLNVDREYIIKQIPKNKSIIIDSDSVIQKNSEGHIEYIPNNYKYIITTELFTGDSKTSKKKRKEYTNNVIYVDFKNRDK